MANTVEQVANDALGLPAGSRLLLVEKLLASLSGNANPAVERAHLVEVQRRRAESRAGQGKLIEITDAMRQARSAVSQ